MNRKRFEIKFEETNEAGPPKVTSGPGDESAAIVQRLFPKGLPRRPARTEMGTSDTRWATYEDLKPWLSQP